MTGSTLGECVPTVPEPLLQQPMPCRTDIQSVWHGSSQRWQRATAPTGTPATNQHATLPLQPACGCQSSAPPGKSSRRASTILQLMQGADIRGCCECADLAIGHIGNCMCTALYLQSVLVTMQLLNMILVQSSERALSGWSVITFDS